MIAPCKSDLGSCTDSAAVLRAGAGLFFSLGGIVLYGIDKSGGSILQPGWMLLLGVLGAGAGLLTAL